VHFRGGEKGGGQTQRTDRGSTAAAAQKSSLDLLGIFDTRRFFYIPTKRVEAEEEKGDGILETLAKWLKKTTS
jgi:hypothetical protein